MTVDRLSVSALFTMKGRGEGNWGRTVQRNHAEDEDQGEDQYDNWVDLQSWALVGVEL